MFKEKKGWNRCQLESYNQFSPRFVMDYISVIPVFIQIKKFKFVYEFVLCWWVQNSVSFLMKTN